MSREQRLDRPDRGKLLIELCGVANCKKCTVAKGRCHWIEGRADQILAFYPDEKEIREQEMERVISKAVKYFWGSRFDEVKLRQALRADQQ